MTLPTTSSVSRPRSQGYDIDIDGTLFRLVPSPDSPASVVTKEREAIDPDSPGGRAGGGESPEFTQFHFSNGEGLRWAHAFDADAFDIHRFWRSQNIVVDLSFGDSRGSASVSPGTTGILSKNTNFTAPDLNNMMVYADGTLFVVDVDDQTQLQASTDPLASSPTFAAESVSFSDGTKDIQALAKINQKAYAANNEEVMERAVGGGWSSLVTSSTDLDSETIVSLWAAKERLLVATGASLWEVTTSGTTNNIMSLESDVMDVTNAGHAILVATTGGHVYALSGDDGDLSLKTRTPFTGEEVLSVEHSQGIVLVTTRWTQEAASEDETRLYVGQLGGDFTLQDLDLIREWDTSTNKNEAACFVTSTQNDFYFTVANPTAGEIWRFNVGTQGLFNFTDSGNSETRGLVIIEDRLFHCGLNGAVRRVGEVGTDIKATGWIKSPVIHFNSHEPKVWSYITVDADLGSDGNLAVRHDTDLDDAFSVITTFTGDGSGRQRYTVHAKDDADFPDPSRYLQLKLDLTVHNSDPIIYNYTVAASPTHTFQLPVLISDVIKRKGRKAVPVPGLGEEIYEKLHDLDESSSDSPRTLKFHRTGDEYIGVVSRVAFQEVSNPKYGGATTIGLVEFLGRKVAGT